MLLPQEGIDKISVLLNPCMVSIATSRHIDPLNHLTLHPAGAFWKLSVHAEYLDIYTDYQWQIATAIFQLIRKGIIVFPNTVFTINFIYNNPQWFILRVVAIEFYSNLRPKNISIVYDAAANGNVNVFTDKNTGETGSIYTADRTQTNGRKSVGIVYDKCKKDLATRRVSRIEWAENPFKQRFEYRLYSNNCEWLHWYNLRGNYFDIFKRHMWYLATVYNNWIYGNFVINAKENVMLKKIQRKATALRKTETECRYRGTKLKSVEAIPKELSKPENITDKQRKQYQAKAAEQLSAFSQSIESIPKLF